MNSAPDDDPDSEFLSNKEEHEAKTDPKKNDSDGDAFEDGGEVVAGTNPLDPNSRPNLDLRVLVTNLDLEFNTAIGKLYQVQGSDDPSPENWTTLVEKTGDGRLFKTNIEVRGKRYKFFKVKESAAQ